MKIIKALNIVSLYIISSLIVLGVGIFIREKYLLFLLFEYTQFIFIIFILAIFFLYFKKKKNHLIKLFIFSLVFKLFFSFFLFYFLQEVQNGFPYISGYGFDESFYMDISLAYAKSGLSGIENMQAYVNFPINYLGYPYFLSYIMKSLEVDGHIYMFINPILMSLAIVFFFKIFKFFFKFTKSEEALLCAILIVSPSLTIYSSLNMKDSLLVLLFSAAFYFFIKSFNSKLGIIYILVALFLMYLMYYIRIQFLVLEFIFFTIYFFGGTKVSKKVKLFSILFVFGVLYYLLADFITENIHLVNFEYIFMSFSKFKKWKIAQSVNPILLLPLIPFSLFLPLPIKMDIPSSIGSTYSSELTKIPIDMELNIYYLFLLSLLPVYLLKINKKYLLYFNFMLVTFLVLIVSNYITYERHRLIFTILTIPIFVKSLHYIKKTNKLYIATIALVFTSFLYTVIRLILKNIV